MFKQSTTKTVIPLPPIFRSHSVAQRQLSKGSTSSNPFQLSLLVDTGRPMKAKIEWQHPEKQLHLDQRLHLELWCFL